LYLQRDFSGSVEEYRDALDLDVAFSPAVFGLGMSLLAMDSLNAAVAAFERGMEVTGGRHLAAYGLLGYTKGLQGDRVAAEAALATMRALRDSFYVSPEYVALVHIGLGEFDAAVDSFYSANRDGSNSVYYFGLEPLLDPLKGYPRFQDLMDSTAVWIRR
jgi:tetratricopeptide (TPR) repeat protein